ncbi:MAG: hypothetical protein FWE74_08955 [Oscillospiraceae bacterium]|nr:hypothetical protein [Oscillospiraceae bacterium]
MNKQTWKIFYIINSIIFAISLILFLGVGGYSFLYLLMISAALLLYGTLYRLTEKVLSYTNIPFIVGMGLVVYVHIFTTGLEGIIQLLVGLIAIGAGYLMAIITIIYYIIRRKKQSKENTL